MQLRRGAGQAFGYSGQGRARINPRSGKGLSIRDRPFLRIRFSAPSVSLLGRLLQGEKTLLRTRREKGKRRLSNLFPKRKRKDLPFEPCPAIFPFVVGMWLSLVEYSVRDAGVAGSNPAIPTSQSNRPPRLSSEVFCIKGSSLRRTAANSPFLQSCMKKKRIFAPAGGKDSPDGQPDTRPSFAASGNP